MIKKEKHFELTEEYKVNYAGVKLFRIKATKDFKSIKKGDLGGFIEKYSNLYGNAWVSGNARVYGDARVSGNARVYGNAEVSGNARVYGDARVSGNARVYGNAWVSGNARVYGDARVSGNAEVYGDAWVSGNARVYGNADFCVFNNFGSRNRSTTFFRTKENVIYANCGCFYGTLKEFENKVNINHGNNKHGKEYLAIIEVVKIKFDL